MNTPYDPIEMALGPASARMGPWQRYLVIYLRLVAGLLLAKAIYSWATICGIGDGPTNAFESLPVAVQVAVVWGAIVNPVAGVGLWLGAAWGVVLWIVATLTQIMANASSPQGLGSLVILLIIELFLVVGYGVLYYKAGQESDT